jgi:cytochrome c oxidase subunit III
VMFFSGILGSYIVLRSGWPHLFEQQGRVLSKWLAGINTLVLIFSSLTMALGVDAARKGERPKLVKCLFATFLCALTFMVIKYVEYTDKFGHYTIVTREGTDTWVYDGHVHEKDGKRTIHGVRARLKDTDAFDIHFVTRDWVERTARANAQIGTGEKLKEEEHPIKGTVAQEWNYGPSRNLFFSCYFAATGVHGLHVVGGMIPLGILTVQAMRRRIFPGHTEYVGLYWHFVDLVWIFLFPLLYLI